MKGFRHGTIIVHVLQGGARIPGKGVQMYEGVCVGVEGGSLC